MLKDAGGRGHDASRMRHQMSLRSPPAWSGGNESYPDVFQPYGGFLTAPGVKTVRDVAGSGIGF